jgi:hypothetical protein
MPAAAKIEATAKREIQLGANYCRTPDQSTIPARLADDWIVLKTAFISTLIPSTLWYIVATRVCLTGALPKGPIFQSRIRESIINFDELEAPTRSRLPPSQGPLDTPVSGGLFPSICGQMVSPSVVLTTVRPISTSISVSFYFRAPILH